VSDGLTGRVVVVSPHLDDAAFSLGAAVAQAARAGADVTVLTVFAGDPESDAPAEWWDRKAGFATLGEAARARREEDRRACEAVGARHEWLPFDDATYEEHHDGDRVWEAVAAAVDGAETVLVPGFPLVHVDHAWLHALLRRRRLPGTARFGLYVEQPYRWRKRKEPLPAGLDWRHLRGSFVDRRAKRRAFEAYASQVPLFGIQPRRRIALYETLQGGEAVAWL
jgi:LmbE family N-acetylglucosaminyl deacetylase